MRDLAHNFYLIVFRVQAGIGMALVVWLISNVPSSLSRDQYIGVPFAGAVFAAVISIACLWPFLTPGWLGRPKRANQVVPLVLSHAALPILYTFVAMGAVVAANVSEAVALQVTLSIFAALMVLTALSCGLGIALCVWPRANHDAEPLRDNISILSDVGSTQVSVYEKTPEVPMSKAS